MQTVLEIQKKVKDAGYPIATMVTYSNMENYESVDSFLKELQDQIYDETLRNYGQKAFDRWIDPSHLHPMENPGPFSRDNV